MKIVIVEDEIRIREGMHKLIDNMGDTYQVVGEAINGEEGLRVIEETEPDLIITDIKMPIMDGLQMLEILYNRKQKTKVIVLSAYSEFAYAQEAIKLGVSEYILKPINVGDLSRAFKTIKDILEQENKKKLGSIESIENIFMSIMFSQIEVDYEIKTYLEERYRIGEKTIFIQVAIYLGDYFDNYKGKVKKSIKSILSEKDKLQYFVLEILQDQTLLYVLYGVEDIKMMERWLQARILLHKKIIVDIPVSIGWTVIDDLAYIKRGYQNLMGCMDWNIVLGEEVMISYPKITQIQTVLCSYPIELENSMKTALCIGDMKTIYKIGEEFKNYFWRGKCYNPKEIKESFVRFLWVIINVAQEVGLLNHQQIEQQVLLEQIMWAKTREELINILQEVQHQLQEKNDVKEENTISLTVKRTQSMIHEFYQTGISLEEIANKLNITPEYLGTQFRKEIGVGFSNYIKAYRMEKAKQLLIGTSLKLYEIAERVGYLDSKYFSRVFKNFTGQLPADYRNTHK